MDTAETPQSLEAMATHLAAKPPVRIGPEPQGELLTDRPCGSGYALELRRQDRGDAGVRYVLAMVNISPNGLRRQTGSALIVSPKSLAALAGVVAAAMRAELAEIPGRLP